MKYGLYFPMSTATAVALNILATIYVKLSQRQARVGVAFISAKAIHILSLSISRVSNGLLLIWSLFHSSICHVGSITFASCHATLRLKRVLRKYREFLINGANSVVVRDMTPPNFTNKTADIYDGLTLQVVMGR